MPEPNRSSRRRAAVSAATSRATRRRSGPAACITVTGPSTDPHENRNQYGNPAYAEVIGAMKREMLELRRQYKDTDEGSARMREIMETHYAPESAKH